MDQTPPEQPLLILAQYVKDFSFENPSAPGIYPVLSQRAPDIKVEVDVRSAVLDERTFEVMLALRISATADEMTAFLVELDYAGVIQPGPSVPEAALEQLLFSETPRLLFPFARSLVAKVTGDAAFPPLFINPIDFDSFYRTHKVGALAAAMESAKAAPNVESPAEETPATESPAPETPAPEAG